MESAKDILQQQAEDALKGLKGSGAVSAQEVADSILHQMVYWERPLPGGDRLLFVRLFSPVVMREEVFLGNVLFNDFLAKAFIRAMMQAGGRAAPVANDLENYYFLVLVRSDLDVSALAAELRAEVERSLPELFFGEPDSQRGIYGSIETMLDFDKANVEPFPVFIMPHVYVPRLEKAVRRSLLGKIQKSSLSRNPTSIMANLAFFYCRDGAEMQSPYLFLARLALRYGVIDAASLWRALNVQPDEIGNDEAAAKKAVEEALKQKNKRTFSPEKLRTVLRKAVTGLGRKVKVADEPNNWCMSYIRSKFLQSDEQPLITELLAPVQCGSLMFRSPTSTNGLVCRVCGAQFAAAEDKSILMGQNTHKFHNQSSKQKDAEQPKTCLRCAMFTYLMVKLLGSEAVGQPQVPKTCNLIFHYGSHTDAEVGHLAKQIDHMWELVSKHRTLEATRREIAEARKALANKVEREKDVQKRTELQKELEQKTVDLQKAETDVAQVENDIFVNFPWMRDVGASPVPSENPALDIISNLQLSESKVERHVLGLGMGGYRMILFVLPQIRPPRDPDNKKPHDFTQSRFSNSWITVAAFLSFLNHLCGCDGPFYYQSLPTLSVEAFQPGVFYVRDRAIPIAEVQRKYAAIYDLAWKLVWKRGPNGFVEKVVLAERLLADPLGTFSTVMRDSPILGQREGGYKKLKAEYRQDWGAQDLTEYARFIQQLVNLYEANRMAVQVDRKALDDFCPRLFRTLDGLGLLPRQLSAKPTEFEKYSRLLLGSIQRYNDVEDGFREWESRVLRAAEYRREERCPELEALRQWVVENASIFTNKANMQHLRSSLYARVFQYLYPRRVLVNAYCLKHQGNEGALGADFLKRDFPGSIQAEVQKVRETYPAEWEAIVADARRTLEENAAYYRKVLSGKEPVETPSEVLEETAFTPEEE